MTICSAVSGCAMTSAPRTINAAIRATRSQMPAGSVVAIRQPARSGPSMSIGRIIDAAAAATIAPAPASSQPNVRRSPRNSSHAASAAARVSGSLICPSAIPCAVPSTITIATPATTAPRPSRDAVCRRSSETAIAAATASSHSSTST